MKRNLLDRVEARLGEILERPVNGAAPIDPKALKEKMVRRLQEAGTAYLPERWYVLLPARLQAEDAEVQAWVHTVWEQFLSGMDKRDWPPGSAPTIAVRYDPDLPTGEMMVGIDPHSVRPLGRPATRPRRPRTAVAMAAAKGLLLALALGIALFALASPGALNWRPALPQLGGVQLPGLSLNPTRYVTTAELRVRSEPTVKAAQVGTMPAGQALAVASRDIVEGESINGDGRWVEVSDLWGRLTGQHRFIWFGGLQPAP
ncbi:MAG: SH3 domain-containing protein [Chloroflexota bacterium]